MKALFISGYLDGLSDNIVPFLDKNTDVYCHTWNEKWNTRWIVKLNRYKKYCNSIKVVVEEPLFDKKLFSYFYSTWKAISIIEDITKYDKVVKFKPNLDGEVLYDPDIEYSFTKAKLQSRPYLENVDIDECIFGTIHYKTLDERILTGKPNAFTRAFNIPEKTFIKQMKHLNNSLILQLKTENYEGSIFWTKWFETKDIFPILHINLNIPNSLNYGNS